MTHLLIKNVYTNTPEINSIKKGTDTKHWEVDARLTGQYFQWGSVLT